MGTIVGALSLSVQVVLVQHAVVGGSSRVGTRVRALRGRSVFRDAGDGADVRCHETGTSGSAVERGEADRRTLALLVRGLVVSWRGSRTRI